MDLRGRHFKFIINPSAGRGKPERIVDAINRISADIEYDYNILGYKGEGADIARKAADSYDVIVAVGGDGTVNEVLNAIAGSQAIFGIIPAGTGNGFARAIGLPLRPEEACRVLIEGHTRELDLGKANDRFFLGTAGTGFDAVISRVAGEKFKWLRGMWLYFVAGAQTFYEYTPQLLNVEIDSRIIQVTPLVVAIANTRRYGGRALIAPDAEPDDGMFDVCVIKQMSAARIVWHLPKLFSGKHVKLDDVSIYRGKRVNIIAPEPVPVHVDGEAIGSFSRIEFKLLHKAIKLIVPREHPGM